MSAVIALEGLDLAALHFKAPVTIVKLHLAAAPVVVPGPIQEPDGIVTLLASEAHVGSDAAEPARRRRRSGRARRR